MNNFKYVFLIGLLFASGCSQENKLMLIIANSEIEVFSDMKYEKNSLFKIKPSEVCAVGEKVSKKVFAYRKVLCSNEKHGYIIAKADKSYKLIKIPK